LSNNKENKSALQLEQLIHLNIPLARTMSLHVNQISNNAICLEAAVADNNINIHGTAFAGSIYSACVLSAWAFTHQRLSNEHVSADVVVAKAEIRYLSPINEMIRCESGLDEEVYKDFQQTLVKNGKSSVTMTVEAKEDGKVKAILEAKVVAIVTDR
jgi:thioesterase domain-containing protein